MNKIVNLERILCAVAESYETDGALQYAIALARSYSAKLFVLTCAEQSYPRPDNFPAIHLAINRAIEHSIIDLPGDANASPLDWELITEDSVGPADAITREAETRNVDLIVMGARRRQPATSILGSTAEIVTRTAPCPVLVTRSRPNQSSAIPNVHIKKVLVAYDFSNDSALALRYGLSIAQEYQSQLHLLHVMADGKTTEAELSWTSQAQEGPYHEAARRLHESVPPEAHLWCQVTHLVREGRPYREIVSYAVEQGIDLICIGASGEGFRLGSVFGSNADRVLRQAPCPVLVVRPSAAQRVQPNQTA
ncbi:MAG TPA: universal stress protein [Pyrinomonadaceae bacterium]|jgi:nucleotide-binding universal stress UspA family protein